MPSPEHDRLVLLAAKWLKRRNFGVVATELATALTAEQPDALGFRALSSAIVEVKVSRSDFLADAHKPWRQGKPSLGLYRFYLCPEGLIPETELPAGWGLLYESGGRVTEVVCPHGNMWPGASAQPSHWTPFQHAVDSRAEQGALYSIARRLSAGKSVIKGMAPDK